MPLLAAAILFVGWTSDLRIRHVEEITDAGGGRPAADASSPTGYIGSARALIIPAHDRESYDWIAQTQETLQRGIVRVRQVFYENVPDGREVRTASLYRWWLAAIAQVIHVASGQPPGICVERAALYGGPLEYLLLLIGATGFAAWRFGGLAAAIAAVSTAALFPLGVSFLPGVADDRSLAAAAALASVLLLLPAMDDICSRVIASAPSRARRPSALPRWAAASGAAGGLGLWNDPSAQLPVVLGLTAAGVLLGWRRRDADSMTAATWKTCWRVWALAGAGAILAGSLVEYFPDDMLRWNLDRVHPLFGIAWLGAGEWVALSGTRPTAHSAHARLRRIAWGTTALFMLAAPGLGQWLAGGAGLFHLGDSSRLLTRLPDGLSGSVLHVLIARGRLDSQLLAALAPALLLVPALWMAMRSSTRAPDRASLIVCLLPALAALGISFAYLGRWQIFDGLLIAVAIASARAMSRSGSPRQSGLWTLAVSFALAPGLVRLWPAATTAGHTAAPVLEIEQTIERGLARWLAWRGDGNVVVWAPPELTSSLHFFGNVRGIGTYAPENHAGLAAALQLAMAGSDDEALARIRRRAITHLVIPSWEGFLGPDPATADVRPGTFLGHLRSGAIPPWLHPVAYPIEPIAGLDPHVVTIFDVIDDQDEPLALSRLAEYWIEAGDLERATAIAGSLQRFPSDVASLTARAEVAAAHGDRPAHDQAIEVLRGLIARGADRYLPWDRRVSLAIAFAHDEDLESTLTQAQHCLDEVTAARLRFLSPKTLFDFQRLAALLDLRVADPKLATLARELLPPDLRRRLAPR